MKKLTIIFVILFCFSLKGQWVALQSGTNLDINSIFFLTEMTGWACCDSGTVLKTTDRGLNWDQYTTSNLIDLFSIHFYDSLNGVTVGSKSSIFKTNDGGITWSLKNLNPDINFNMVRFVDSAKVLVAGNNAKILLSTDRGNNWQTINTPLGNQNLLNISILNTQIIWVGGDRAILKSVNGGYSWTFISGGRDDTKIFAFNDSLLWKIGWTGTGTPEPWQYIEKSSNGGANWVVQYIAIGNNLKSIHISNRQIGFVLNYWNTILNTTNSGLEWEDQQYFSTPLNDFCFIDSTTGWIVGNSGYIFRTTNGGGIFTEVEGPDDLIQDFVLYQNYPNPFNPNTKIVLSIPHKNFVVLKVYDLLCNEIATLVNEEKQPGMYEVQFDGRNLSSGIYLYKIIVGNFYQIKKMLLIK